MDNPDDPALQDECANRLLAYAARRRAALTRPRSQTFSTPREGSKRSACELTNLPSGESPIARVLTH